MWFSWQKVLKQSSCLCIPWNEFENKIKSSAHNKWQITCSPRHTPLFVSKYVPKSAMYFLKRNPLATPPWFTPSLSNILSLIRPYNMNVFRANYFILAHIYLLYSYMYTQRYTHAIEIQSAASVSTNMPHIFCNPQICKTYPNLVQWLGLPYKSDALPLYVKISSSVGYESNRPNRVWNSSLCSKRVICLWHQHIHISEHHTHGLDIIAKTQ